MREEERERERERERRMEEVVQLLNTETEIDHNTTNTNIHF